ncbi:VQ motif-containing protein 4-like [Benincasa hispida]|uniref:VQ motif-containing protein 4-like n=1 Tax=Benincasa hispida TaxID=102211 RepID=UPI0019006223|nr:VQ motif-containing protein 4-like [Benincasa hispida]
MKISHPNSSFTSTSTTTADGLPPPPHKIINRSDSTNPYPTTFVQADTSSFKQVVQMLTGSPETAKQVSTPDPPSKSHIPPIKSIPKRQHSSFKLYERRNALHNLQIINPVFASSVSSPRNIHNHPEILSPSMLDFPSLVLSPVTPLIPDPFGRSQPLNSDPANNVNCSNSGLDEDAEAKAIREKGFYLHPSPATTPRESEPQLLPLFPITSPPRPGPPPPSSS